MKGLAVACRNPRLECAFLPSTAFLEAQYSFYIFSLQYNIANPATGQQIKIEIDDDKIK
jgi:hypothetical protein